jgi:hypothetical protein
MKIKELSKHIKKNGFDYTQIEATDKGYIYSQSYEGEIIAYEVFERRINTYFECVSFPGNEAFGAWAWTYKNLETAQRKLQSL